MFFPKCLIKMQDKFKCDESDEELNFIVNEFAFENFENKKEKKTMGIRSEITKPINVTICKDPRLAGHAFCGPVSSSAKKTLELLQGELDELEYSLEIVESVTEFSDHAHKIEALRGRIGQIKGAISTVTSYASLYEDGKQLLGDIRRIRRFNPEIDPVGAAKAYGAAMQSLGKLIEKIPGIPGAVGTLIAEMGKIFAKVVGDIGLHTRGTSQRLDEQWKQANGGKSLFD